MGDIATFWIVSRGVGDWQLAGPLLSAAEDLQTAVLISLFTDRVVDQNEIPDGSGDPRGWWGDTGEAYPIGSRLWLLARAKQMPSVLTHAHDYCAEALQWMIDDGVVASIGILCEFTRPGMLGIQIVLFKSDGVKTSFQFDWAWAQLSAAPTPNQAYAAPVDPYAVIWESLGILAAYDEGYIADGDPVAADEGFAVSGMSPIFDEGILGI